MVKFFIDSIGGALANVKIERTEVVQVGFIDAIPGWVLELTVGPIG
jgi:hypothetical protein